MKKMMKRAAVTVLAGIMAAGMLTGCAKEELDGSKVVATVDGTDIEMGVVSLYARYQQAQTEAMYLSFTGTLDNLAIWNSDSDEEGKTYGEYAVEETVKQIQLMNIMKAKAADYGVEVTEEDQAAIADAAAEFMAANTEEAIADLAVTEEQVKTFLELYTYMEKMYSPITADVDTEVSDEDAQQSAFSYVCVSVSESDDEETVETKKADADAILAAMLEDPEADMETVADEINEEYMSFEGTFTTVAPADEEESASYPLEVLAALRELEEGEVHDAVIEADNGYYIVRLDLEYDEETTETKKESIIDQRRDDLYTEVTEGWLEEAELTVDEEVLATLRLTDNHHFTITYPETEETDEEELILEDEEAVDEEIADEEIVEEETEE